MVGLGVLLSAGADAKTDDAPPRAREALISQGEASPTRAWVAFCKRHPAECDVNRSEAATVTLTPETWSLIKTVNSRVNTDILPLPDSDHWGVDDRWDFPDDGIGDCEDIQILKRKILSEAGLPRRAMRMTVVIDEEGAGHAVLLILTDHGDFVLDNKRDAVLLWQQTAYTYIKREGVEGRAWVSLGHRQQPLVTANR